MTSILGLGAATILGPDYIVTHGGTNMSTPLLARFMAGDIFFAFVSAVAFATILAVVAGLTISASTSFAHDFWTNVIHRGVERKPGETVLVARVAAFVVGAVRPSSSPSCWDPRQTWACWRPWRWPLGLRPTSR